MSFTFKTWQPKYHENTSRTKYLEMLNKKNKLDFFMFLYTVTSRKEMNSWGSKIKRKQET